MFDNNAVFWGVIGPLIGTGITLWLNWMQGKENRQIQKEISNQQINANLKAKARIEWINEVRNKSSNFISLLLSIQKNDVNYNEQWLKIEEASELLKLFFNSNSAEDVKSDISINKGNIELSQEAEKILMNRYSNENKNIYLRRYIDVVVQKYNNNTYQTLFEQKTYVLKRQYSLLQEKEEMSDKNLIDGSEFIQDGDDSEFLIYMSVPKEGKEEEYEQLEKNIAKTEEALEYINQSIKGFHEAVNQFSLLISIYLKIEWDLAKKGK